jgi:hypothetical protein
MRNKYSILLGKPERKRPPKKFSFKRKDNIKKDIKEIGIDEFIMKTALYTFNL